jgi:mannosyltransferase
MSKLGLWRPARHPLRPLFRILSSHWKVILFVATLMIIEVVFHVRSYTITRPSQPLDAPFYTGCQSPILNTTARENAVILMLARNPEVKGAIASVRSVQEQFNDNFGYPWVFLNDEAWSEDFKKAVTTAVQNTSATGTVKIEFDVIPKAMWGFPAWIDQERARHNMKAMEAKHIQYAGQESYHHMCRFQSGYVFSQLFSSFSPISFSPIVSPSQKNVVRTVIHNIYFC